MRALLLATAIVVCFATAISLADTTAAKSSPFAALGQPIGTQAAGTPSLNQGALHVDTGTEFENADFFRGIRQPVNSPAFQGWVDLHFDAAKIGDLNIGSYVGLKGGGAEKSHNGAPFTDYLQEVYLGGTFQYNAFSVDVGYAEHHAPDGTFATQNEIGARLDFDDTSLMQQYNIPILLQPHTELFREVLDQSAVASSRSEPHNQNSYWEVGIAPQHRFALTDSGAWSLNVAMPITLGMSCDNYYSLTPGAKSDFLGFFSVGAMAGVALPVPPQFGAWDLRCGVTWYSDTARGPIQVDHSHANFFTAGMGLAMHY